MLSNRGPVLRGLLLVLVLLAWLVAGAFGGMAQGSLSEVQENDQAAFLPENAESTRAAELAREFSDSESLPALVLLRAEAEVTQDQVRLAERLAEKIPEVPLPDGTLGDVLVGPVAVAPSEDGRALLLPVALQAEEANETVAEGERLVNVAVDGIRALVEEEVPGSGLEAWVTGPAGFVADLVAAFGGIDGILLAVALVVVLVILIAVYRSPFLPFTVLLTAVFALSAAALVVKPLAGNGVLLLNGQSQGILAILVVGAATDYSLLLVARYREELTRHARPAAAMAAAWRATLEPVAASAGTVIVGLLCLLLSDLGSTSSLGPVAAIGIVSSVLAALTLLPALLLVLGSRSRAVFWPRPPRYDAGEGRTPVTLWDRVARVVTERARLVWVGSALALLAAAAFVPTLRAEGTAETDVYLSATESVAGQEVLAEHFEEGQTQPAVVITAESAAEEVRRVAEGLAGVDSATLVTTDGPSAGGPPEEAGQRPPEGGEQPGGEGAGAERPSDEPVVVDGRVQVQVVTEAAAESQDAVDTVAELRREVQQVDPDAVVGGAAAERLDTQATAARDLRVIVPVVLGAILVMLVLLLRSVLAPVLLVLANVLSFGATMGISALVFNHVLDFPGADPTVPLYGFVFLVALGIDYSIFLMTRVREEAMVVGTRRGVRTGLAVTGGVITSAGLVLAATFSALAVIPLLFLAQLAFIVGFGVLLDTFVVRSLLVPGLVHDLGRRAWWPRTSQVPAD